MRGKGQVTRDGLCGRNSAQNTLVVFSIAWECYLHLCVLFWPHHVACMISVPWPGIKPVLPRVGTQNPSYWTGKEVPASVFNKTFFLGIEGRAVYRRGKILLLGEAYSLNF